MSAHTRGRESDPFLSDAYFLVQGSGLPFLQVAHHAIPRAFASAEEVLLILHRQGWFQDEDFYQSAKRVLILCGSGFSEVQTSSDHTSVVENHQSTLRQIIWKATEMVLADVALLIH